MILSRDLDEHRILQSDWETRTTDHYPPLIIFIQKTKISLDFSKRYRRSNNPATWMVGSILCHNWRIFLDILFLDMQHWLNHEEDCHTPFLGYKKVSRNEIFEKRQKDLFWRKSLALSLEWEFSWKNLALWLIFYP